VGDVSLENNGDFVQIALDLAPDSNTFDASAWTGLQLDVFGNDEEYGVHLRTSDLTRPGNPIARASRPRRIGRRSDFPSAGSHRTARMFRSTFTGASRGRLSVDPHTGRLVEFAISQGHARATLRVEHGAFAAAEAEMNEKSASFLDKLNLDNPIDSAAAFLIEDALKGGPLAVLWFDKGTRKERPFAAAVHDRIFSQEVLSH